MTADELREFEREIAQAFDEKRIRAPIHLSGGNEDELIKVFKNINPDDWVFASYRSHYHALLHGVPRNDVMQAILDGRSMHLHFPEYHFFTTAIVSGCCPIAVGVAFALRRQSSTRKVWCFVGDMAATTGAFCEAAQYADRQNLPIHFVIEDNGLSCNTPTAETWGLQRNTSLISGYKYKRFYPHVGLDHWVQF